MAKFPMITTTSKALMLSAALTFMAGVAQAAITVDDVVKSYTDGNFTSIQVVETATRIKVEAVKDGVKLEVTYDKASGDVVKREQSKASAEDLAKSGVAVTTGGTGSSDSMDDDTNGSDHDSGTGHDAGEDHGSEDHGSSNDSSGHDSSEHDSGSNSGHDSNDN